ncbi:fungal-specific transcription factor domain-containing protein [Aspergillus carlsbadensis]|nr:fungal-specific transcription factor domain-containing protein [Aspergillus carlsbadensis]
MFFNVGCLSRSKMPQHLASMQPQQLRHNGSQSDNRGPETESVGPAYKRRRVALACRTCRKRKSRCDGARPTCRHCAELGQDCTYDPPTRGSYVSQEDAHQRFLAIEDKLNELLEWRKTDNGNKAAPPLFQFGGDSTSDTGMPNDFETDDEVGIADPLDVSLDGMTVLADSVETGSTFFGPSSNIAFLRHISNALSLVLVPSDSAHEYHAALTQPLVSIPSSPILTMQTLSTSGSHPVNIRALPSEAQGLRLIRLYFADTGMVFPYMHEEEVLTSYQAVIMQRTLHISRTFSCLLNAIFATATYISVRKNLDHQEALAESDNFYARAKLLASKLDLECSNVQTVQALLLMHQYCLATQRSAQIWNLHALTIRIAMQLGLHSATTLKTFPPLEAEIRKRTWFGCVILDRTLSTTFGRPPAIPNDFVTLPLPTNESLDFMSRAESSSPLPESTDEGDTVCLFTATTELYLLQGTIIANLYGNNLDSTINMSVGEVLKQIVDLEQRLLTWKRDLPLRLQRTPWRGENLDDIATSAQSSPFNRLSVMLALRYLNVRLLLRRPLLILCLVGDRCLVSNQELPSDDGQYFTRLISNEITTSELDALEIIRIVSKTNPHPSLRTVWWFSSYYCFSAALTIFCCILLRLRCKIILQDLPTSGRVAELGRNLQVAVETLQAYGNNAPVRRARKTLTKLYQIHIGLVGAHYTSSDPSSPPDQTGEPAFRSNQPLVNQTNVHENKTGTRTDLDAGTALTGQDEFDPTANFPLSYLMADGNIDIFTDLGGLDPDLAAFIGS